jgi:LysR family carnitine catabolism transcriptional activator
MDLRRLRLFVAVAEQGGFTAAAEAVHVAQPAVSLAVRELEQELGATLVTLLGPARQALRDVEHAAEAVAAVTGLVAGHLDLACLPTLAADPVAELVGRFRSAHPGVTVRMGAPQDLTELAEAVRKGAADVGITERGAANEGLEEITIAEQELLAVGPPAPRRDRSTGPLRLDRLDAVPLVLSPTGSSLRDAVDLALEEVGARPDIGVETAQRDALIPLVLAGAGTTFLPDTLARAAERLGAVVRRTRPRLRRTIAIVHRPGDPGPAARRFLSLATT